MSFVIYISNCTLAVVVFLWMFPVTFSVFVFNFEEFISLLEPKSSLHVVFVLQTRLSKVLTQASAVHRDVDTNRLWRSSVNSAGSWQWFHFLLPALHLSPDPPLRGALSLCAPCVRGTNTDRNSCIIYDFYKKSCSFHDWTPFLYEKSTCIFYGHSKTLNSTISLTFRTALGTNSREACYFQNNLLFVQSDL